MRILKPSDIRKDIVAFFRSESLVPIVGAGLSCNVPTLRGKVLSGTTYKEHMLQALLKNSQFTPEEHDQLKSEKFSTLCDYYEDDENEYIEIHDTYCDEWSLDTYEENDFEVDCEEVEIKDTYKE